MEFSCDACAANPNGEDCDELEIVDVELPWHGTLDNHHAPDVYGSEAGDVAIRFTVDGHTAVQMETCLPGTEIDTDSYWFVGASPCEGGGFLLEDQGDHSGQRDDDDDEDDDCSHATGVERGCENLLPAGTYVVLLSGPDDDEGEIEVQLTGLGCAEVEAEDRLLRLELGQNAPNPFNPATTIRFQLEQTGLARLSVFDIMGRDMGVLVDGLLESGSHQVVFDRLLVDRIT